MNTFGRLGAGVVVAATTVVIGLSSCSAKEPEPPAPGVAELARLTEAARHLDEAGSYQVTYQMDANGEFFAKLKGTVAVSLANGGVRSHGTAHVDITGLMVQDSADVELIDPGTGTTYVKGPSVGSAAAPWRELTNFSPNPERGAAGTIAYAELLNSVVFDPRQYITSAPAEGLAGSFEFTADAPTGPATLKASCSLNVCAPADRLQAWIDQHKLRWLGFDVTIRLSADNRLEGFDVSFDYGNVAGTSAVKIRATLAEVGQPVTIETPADSLITRS
jgi:hypothetical protein